MRKADIVSAAAILLLGLAALFVVIPVWIPVILEGDYGLRARDMPTVAALAVTGLAAMFLAHRLRAPGGPSAGDARADAAPPIPRRSWLFILRASAFLIAVTALFEWAGFLVAGPVTVGGFMYAMGERRRLHIAVTAVAATGAIWLLFWQLLRFALP